MARRDEKLVEDVFYAVAKLPWWVGVLSALFAYLLLHHFAIQPPPVPSTIRDAGNTVVLNLIRAFAAIGQYLLPILFLAAAGASAIGRWKRQHLARSIAESTEADPLKSLSWEEFEQLVGEAFRQLGYQAAETPPGPDGGVDLVLRKDGETYLVQCKHWRATKVGVPIVRELFGVMADRGAAGAFVVTSGTFTRDALAFANGRNIELLNGRQLEQLLRKARTSDTERKTEPPRPPRKKVQADGPPCPNYGSPMVKRTARRGKNAGKQFWGCSRYPACKGIRQVS